MKNKNIIIVVLMVLSLSLTLKALGPDKAISAYHHLYEVNKEWGKRPQAAPQGQISFATDIERISYHLTLVEKYLRKNTPKTINNEALKQRLALLDTLQAYAKAGIFPQNIYHSERTPYFIDHRGVHCAVGYLMKASGKGDLAAQISQEQNYAYLRDIKTAGVAEWAAAFGFEGWELAWIQPGYGPYSTVEPLLNGTNGVVKHIATQYVNGSRLVFAGDFTVADTIACSGIGYYQNGEMHCLGGGLIGDIQDMYVASNLSVMIAGSLDSAGMLYPGAIYNNTNWQYLDIPTRTGAMATAISNGHYNSHSVELAISHAAIPGKQEIWYLMNNGNWEKRATIHGTIYDIAYFYDLSVFEDKSMYAGAFDSITIHLSGFPDSTIGAYNVATWGSQSNHWMTFNQEVPDTINVIKTIGDVAYLGGNATGTALCLSRYSGGYIGGLITANVFVDSIVQIYDIDFYEDELLLAGNFTVTPLLFGYYGNNLMKFNLLSNFPIPLGEFNKPVRSTAYLGSQIHIGGAFDTCYTPFGAVPHLGKVDFNVAISNTANPDFAPLAYPNPVQSRVNIEIGTYAEEIQTQLIDLSGRVLLSREFRNEQLIQMDLAEIPSGLYLLQITADGQRSTEKLRVEN